MIDASHTLANERRDFAEWHRGRAPYVVWALDVDVAPMRGRIAAARHHLDGLLLDAYERQPHVTLELCGFPADSPQDDEEFSPDWVEAQIASLRRLALPSFELQVGALRSFASAPYFAVADTSGEISAIRQALAVDRKNRLNFDYVPHVTVGLYGGTWPAAEVISRLAGFDAGEPLKLRIDRVSLMAYEPSLIGGRLTTLSAVELVA